MKLFIFLSVLFLSCTDPYYEPEPIPVKEKMASKKYVDSSIETKLIETPTIDELNTKLQLTISQQKNQAYTISEQGSTISSLITKDSLKSVQIKNLTIESANKTTQINNLKKDLDDYEIINGRSITALKKSDSITNVKNLALIKDTVTQAKKIASLMVSSAANYTRVNMLVTDKAAKERTLATLMRNDSIFLSKMNPMITENAAQNRTILLQGVRITTIEDSMRNLIKTMGTDFDIDTKKRVKISETGIERIKGRITSVPKD